jgi:thermostable 8-oxoguanine DNA glycosylase
LRGGGRFRTKISCNPRRKKIKIIQHTIEKKNIMQKRALKKNIPTCKSTDALHFSIVSTGLQDFAFLSRHICLKEHGVNSEWTTSQGL